MVFYICLGKCYFKASGYIKWFMALYSSNRYMALQQNKSVKNFLGMVHGL